MCGGNGYHIWPTGHNFGTMHTVFLPEAFRYCCRLRLFAYMCVCVPVCVGQPKAWPRHNSLPMKLVSPNVDQRCKIPWLRSLFFLLIYFFPFFFGGGGGGGGGGGEHWPSNLSQFWLVRTISHYVLKLCSPNLGQMCKALWLRFHYSKYIKAMITYTASRSRLFHSLNHLHVCWSRPPMVFRRLTLLLLMLIFNKFFINACD